MMRRALVLLAVAACGDNLTREPSPPGVEVIEVASFAAVPSRDLDLLLMIDDSGGAAELQRSFAQAIPTSLLPSLLLDGRLPNLHVGVITSDLGTSSSLGPPAPAIGSAGAGGCAGVGKDGALSITGATVNNTYVIDEDDGAGGRRRNYDGELGDVLAAIVQPGDSACGFEQPLAAIRRAFFFNPANVGFERPSASLAIVILTNEDDCSVRDPRLFDPEDPTLGPLQSFRCTVGGVVCGQLLVEVGPKTDCAPATGSTYIEDPAVIRDALVLLEPRRHRLSVAAIIGPPTPFAIEESMVAEPRPALAHSCSYQGIDHLAVADPGVRIAAFVDSFGSRGVVDSICAPSLAPQLARVATHIKQSLGVACLDTSRLADARPDAGVQPSCELYDVLPDDTRVAIPRCPDDGDCWELRTDRVACPELADGARIVIDRKQPPSAETYVEVYCEVPRP